MQGQENQRIGDYEILGTLGAGGMGRVYRVRHVISDRVEAMKILLPDLSGRKELVERFLREIKLVASLNHPNIATLCTALTIENQLIMVMEFVEGVSLAELLSSGPIRIPDAVNYLDQVLAALDHAHKRGIVHRDIKPANIMLTTSGVVKLMDFGIARVEAERQLTQTGTTLGSIDYMSPEQIMGHAVDARADLYSVGVSYYEMVTGQRPFRGNSDYELMAAHVKEAPRNPIEIQPWLPAGVSEIILKSIAKAPEERFQTAGEFREALRQFSEGGKASGAGRSATIVEMRRETVVEALSPLLRSETSLQIPGRQETVLLDNSQLQRGMTQVAGTPVYQPPVSAGYAGGKKKSSRRLAYLVCAGVLAAGAIAGSVGYVSHHHDDDSKADRSVSTPPVAPGGSTEAKPAQQPNPLHKVAHPVQPDTRGKITATGKLAVSTPPPSPATTPASSVPPPMDAAKKAKLDELETQIDQLNSRATAANNSLNNMQRSMQKDGMALRGDVVARQASMNTNLGKTRQAFGQQDPDRASRFASLTEADLQQLEAFLGR